MKAIKTKGAGFFKFLKILLLAVFVISTVLLTISIISMVKTQNAIRNNLDEIVQQVKEQTGAYRVDIDIYSEPGGELRILPVEYHVFLTAHCDNLKGKSDSQWVAAMLNGKEPCYEYGYDNYEHAIYAMTVNVSGREHPVIVSVTDGDSSYSVYGEFLIHNDPTIEKRDARAVLHPSKLGSTVCTYMIAAFLSLVGLVLLMVRDAKQKKAIKEQSVKFYAECEKRGIDINRSEQKEQAIETGKTFADACRIGNLDSCYQEFALLGKSTYEKIKKNATKGKSKKSADGNSSDNIDVDAGLEQLKSNRKKTAKIILCTSACVIGLALAALAVMKLIVLPANRYKQATELKNVGEHEAAYQIFKELGNYKDSKKICEQYDFDAALENIEAGNYAKAYQLLTGITKNKEATAKAEELLAERPYLSVLSADVGSEVQFGSYEQNSGIEPISWYVVSKENGSVLLVSKYILDAQQFNTKNTADCTLDDWLKTDFYNAAFGDVDEKIIAVTFLSRGDAEHYLTSEQASCEPTAFAKSRKGFTRGYDDNYYYWAAEELYTSSGDISVGLLNDSYISDSVGGAVTHVNGVRPAIWICPDGEEDFPAEYIVTLKESGGNHSGHSGGGGSSSSVCPSCNGKGKKTVKWYSEGDWGEASYTTYTCPQCNGTGRK